MFLRIETILEKKFVGICKTMSFADNYTFEIWSSFMPKRKEITNALGSELYSIEVYDNPFYFEYFNPTNEFEKWAAIEVTDFNSIPKGMTSLIAPAGLYAVFLHKGPASEGPATYNYIFRTWLPESAYVLDNRPHFAVMGVKYKHDDPDSEEEIWIPIKQKNT